MSNQILKTLVTVVLDRSGSMQRGKQHTIDGFNEQIQTLKSAESETSKSLVTLVTFNDRVEVLFDAIPVNSIPELTEQTYIPSGMTAMYDGVGEAIRLLEKRDDINDPNVSVLMVILSDGEENASRVSTQAHIAEKIQSLKDTGRWTFTYMGANVDLSTISTQLNLDIGNVISFNASSEEGYAQAAMLRTAGTEMYMKSRSVGAVTASADFYSSVVTNKEA